MKLKAIAKFDRNPRVRRSSGLIPSERRWASSFAAWSAPCMASATRASLLQPHRRGAGRSLEGTLGRDGLRSGALSLSPSTHRTRAARYGGPTGESTPRRAAREGNPLHGRDPVRRAFTEVAPATRRRATLAAPGGRPMTDDLSLADRPAD